MAVDWVNISGFTIRNSGSSDDPDYDAGIYELKKNLSSPKDVVKIFKENNERVKLLINEIVTNIPDAPTCKCPTAMDGALLS